MRHSLFIAGFFAIGLLSGCGSEQKQTRSTEREGTVMLEAAVGTDQAIAAAAAGLKIPVLVYHHIRKQQGWSRNSWSWKMTVSPEVFEKHMQWLSEHGYVTVTLDMMVELLQGKRTFPEKPVVITFDDNTLTSYDPGATIMEKYGHIGVYYIVSNRIDNPNIINRERIKDLAERGHDIQSHTITHRALPPLPAVEIEREMRDSKRILEELIGKPVRHVAYPGTAHNPTVRALAKAAGYVTGSVMDPKRATPTTDLHKLPRIMMTDTTDLAKVLP